MMELNQLKFQFVFLVLFALTAVHAQESVNLKSETSRHYVGELYGGGVVFKVDQTGEHGLILGMVDIDSSFVWSNVRKLIGFTTESDGAANTQAIIGQKGHLKSAAKLCSDYTNVDYGTGSYSDWYLPGIAEANNILYNIDVVQKTLENDGNPATIPLSSKITYWSSTEYYTKYAWVFRPFSFKPTYVQLKYYVFNVRPVRAF